MKIGELANQAGCSVETVRYYEKEGLIPEPLRTSGNYRDYSDRHVESLLFIRHCRALDMSHDEIRQLLHWREHPLKPCGEVNALIDRHILHVTERICLLQSLEAQLRALRNRCYAERDVERCGILQELASHTSDTAYKSDEKNPHAHSCVHENASRSKI